MSFAPETLERAIARLEALPDASARGVAREALSAVLDYHADALRRLCERLGDEALRPALDDATVASMFVLHGIHPTPLEGRVRHALATLGADADLLSVTVDAIRARVRGTEAERRAVARAIAEAAPEVEQVDVSREAAPNLVPVARLNRKRGARCELCGEALGEEHEHVFDLEQQQPKCACAACSVLLGSSASRVRRIRTTKVRLDDVRIDDAHWRALEVPVDLAFFSQSSRTGEIVVGYPSPAGAVRSTVPLEAWRAIVASNPALAELEPDVEALLVDRRTATPTYHLVSIDECYRLVGLVRSHWQGITGGDGAARALDELLGRERS